ncbi:MAG: tetratricopeptide repeat protein [Deltaproteobacteria bacterium]|nr:tetratricopeptide repeat protein [Deltaproteobacteria bacterium]
MGLKSVLSIALGFCIFMSAGCVQENVITSRERAQALQSMGGALVREGNLREGLARLLEAEKLDPDNPALQHELAIAYRDLGKYDISLRHFQKALYLKPDFSEAHNNLGTLYILLKKWDLAVQSFNKAVQDILYKTPEIAYNNMGLAYFNKGDTDRAIESYEKALQLSPSYHTCLTNLGIAYETNGDLVQAIESYNNSIRFGSRNPATYFRLAGIYKGLNQRKEAAGVLKQFLSIEKEGTNADAARDLLRQVERR